MIYYDKAYRSGLARRDAGHVLHVDLENANPNQNARKILGAVQAIPLVS
ncbi:hypothetical protein [Chryseolinea soli]|nr:hypothetical protein [Chryseolinea soli]